METTKRKTKNQINMRHERRLFYKKTVKAFFEKKKDLRSKTISIRVYLLQGLTLGCLFTSNETQPYYYLICNLLYTENN